MRKYNFGAGPAMLPTSILQEAQNELLDWNGLGMSVIEVGHRTPAFQKLLEETEADLRLLLDIPENYIIRFLGGAARTQFSMIPMNFLNHDQAGGYLVTGTWSSLAYQEALKLKSAYCLATNEEQGFQQLPTWDISAVKEKTGYLYYTPNETIQGIRYPTVPKVQGIPLVADMTSSLLTEPIQVKDYDLIFAGAQKNVANAGLTIVILNKQWLEACAPRVLPSMLDYRVHLVEKTYATPPTFNCYLAGKMFKWLLNQGGMQAIYEKNLEKSWLLYELIENSTFYHCNVPKNSRSLVNICFHITDPSLQTQFLADAEKSGLLALKGHRLVGGLRASLYNSMPLEGVKSLTRFMENFAKKHAPH
ncbi:MAG: 3-phosphoserine/phosphohydroxythreonine transaminase [Legionella sp.]|nr:3-phosphoserine/phosphohydroxythreonine transaminase [Legionella sp.]